MSLWLLWDPQAARSPENLGSGSGRRALPPEPPRFPSFSLPPLASVVAPYPRLTSFLFKPQTKASASRSSHIQTWLLGTPPWGCMGVRPERGSGRTDPVGSPGPSECPRGPLRHSGRCRGEWSAMQTRCPLPSGSSCPLESRETKKGAIRQSGGGGEGQEDGGQPRCRRPRAGRGVGLSGGLAFPLHRDR